MPYCRSPQCVVQRLVLAVHSQPRTRLQLSQPDHIRCIYVVLLQHYITTSMVANLATKDLCVCNVLHRRTERAIINQKQSHSFSVLCLGCFAVCQLICKPTLRCIDQCLKKVRCVGRDLVVRKYTRTRCGYLIRMISIISRNGCSGLDIFLLLKSQHTSETSIH